MDGLSGGRRQKPDAVLRMEALDIAVLQTLCLHWTVIVQDDDGWILIELYKKKQKK